VDPLFLSRLQFATTTVYHFFFVPLTLGLGWFVAILETLYVRSGKEEYKRLAKFWGKLFLINFAVGVVTGIVQEFQFGMNWSEYARFVGDVFGSLLAIEALLAFFMESTFLGVWIFGWDRVPKGVHLASIWLVVLGSNLSALWILLANGFMQHPVGYAITAGRAQMVDFAALALNPRGWLFFFHTITSGLVTAAFLVLGISVYHLARKRDDQAFRLSFRLAAIIGLVSAALVVGAGDMQGRYLRQVQPMAAAASEALWETSDPAPFSVVAIFDAAGKKPVWSLDIPYALSMLYYLKPSGQVEGISNIQQQYVEMYGPGDYVPPVALGFWMFRIMVGTGFLMIALAAYALALPLLKWNEKWMRWMKVLLPAILLPYIANTTGWILTETGRQPWIVTGLLKTPEAVSPNLTGGMVFASLLGFALIYGVLMVVDVYLLVRYARAGLPAAGDEAGASSY
jgi:cytochrome bd ubiquinol oxidase subunit I